MITLAPNRHIGDEIFINRDLIYPREANGHKSAVGVDFAVGVLTYQFGSRGGDLAPDALASVAEKTARFARMRTEVLQYGTYV